jgi:putative acetyltransferase
MVRDGAWSGARERTWLFVYLLPGFRRRSRAQATQTSSFTNLQGRRTSSSAAAALLLLFAPERNGSHVIVAPSATKEEPLRGSVAAMHLRPYRDSDAAASRRVFERAVHVTAAGDYTTCHVRPGRRTSTLWVCRSGQRPVPAPTRSWLSMRTKLPALAISSTGPYSTCCTSIPISPDVGSAARSSQRSSVSRDQRAHPGSRPSPAGRRAPSSNAKGFAVVARQAPVIRGVAMTNFKMRLDLDGA